MLGIFREMIMKERALDKLPGYDNEEKEHLINFWDMIMKRKSTWRKHMMNKKWPLNWDVWQNFINKMAKPNKTKLETTQRNEMAEPNETKLETT